MFKIVQSLSLNLENLKGEITRDDSVFICPEERLIALGKGKDSNKSIVLASVSDIVLGDKVATSILLTDYNKSKVLAKYKIHDSLFLRIEEAVRIMLDIVDEGKSISRFQTLNFQNYSKQKYVHASQIFGANPLIGDVFILNTPLTKIIDDILACKENTSKAIGFAVDTSLSDGIIEAFYKVDGEYINLVVLEDYDHIVDGKPYIYQRAYIYHKTENRWVLADLGEVVLPVLSETFELLPILK